MKFIDGFNGSTTLADGVAESILQYVKNKHLAPGDLLPKEEEIASQLNVSRHIVREGISGLKTLGVIESRKRKGMFLRHKFNAFESVSKLAKAGLFSKEEYRQFMQIRVIMELGMAKFIWQNRTPEKIAELRAIAEKKEILSIQDEIDFHSKLFSMSGNDIANQFQNILNSAFAPNPHPSGKWRDDIPTHLKICEVLENCSCQEFTDIMEKHFIIYL